ncbi:MAG: ribonuclease III [Myxococcota bacterium]|nr:ribonuclease III [Myxococcota bacterium]
MHPSEEPERELSWSELESALGHRFGSTEHLEEALRHASFANEREGMRSNDRLEFLGDAVVGLVTARLLFEANPDWDEGTLTRGLHRIVDRRGLASLARRLGLGGHLRLGATEKQSHGEEKDSILADAMEAVLAAVYLDAGLGPVQALIEREFGESLRSGVSRDAKTAFQEWVMATYGEFPTYQLQSDSGEEGDIRRFSVEACIRGEVVSMGVGRSKRSAEFAAAAEALDHKRALPPKPLGEG